MLNINNFKNIFILGIGGSGMSSIAKYLKQKGFNVEGYDQRTSYIVELLSVENIETIHSLDSVSYREDYLYIVSSAITIENTFLRSFKNKLNVLTRPKFLEILSKEENIIGVTGTHGKTSTTALLSHIFQYNNRDISYIYGGVNSFGNIGGHFGGKNAPLVLETDEAFNTFKNIDIQNLLVTNIDDDHLDFYGNYQNLCDAFTHVIKNTKNNVVLNIEDSELRKLEKYAKLTYSKNFNSYLKIISKNEFCIDDQNFTVDSNLIGEHYLMNISGAILTATLLGISIEDALNAVKTFPGVKRRMELKGIKNNIRVFDDYGHHPTEILVTINSLKEITEGELYVVFQPHRFTRTRDNFKAIKESLEVCNNVIVTDIFSAGEEPIPGVRSKNFQSKNITYLNSLTLVPEYLKRNVKTGDCILTLGAGDVTLLGQKILEALDG